MHSTDVLVLLLEVFYYFVFLFVVVLLLGETLLKLVLNGLELGDLFLEAGDFVGVVDHLVLVSD